VTRHVFCRHAKRQCLDLEAILPALERFARKGIDFEHLFVRHRIAAGGRAGAMHHEVRAGAAMGAIEPVRVAEIEREVVAGIGVHLVAVDGIEAFRRLAIAFGALRTQLTRPFADLVFGDLFVAAVGLGLPHFKNAFFLEDAHHDRGGLGHVVGLHAVDDLRRQRMFDLVRDARQRIAAVARRQCEAQPRNHKKSMPAHIGCPPCPNRHAVIPAVTDQATSIG